MPQNVIILIEHGLLPSPLLPSVPLCSFSRIVFIMSSYPLCLIFFVHSFNYILHSQMKASVLCLYGNQQMHIYKYVQSNTIILHQHVSVTPVTTIRLSYDKNTISVQMIVQKCMIKPLDITLECKVKWFYHTFLYKLLVSWLYSYCGIWISQRPCRCVVV
jgi:hypothetical protein